MSSRMKSAVVALVMLPVLALATTGCTTKVINSPGNAALNTVTASGNGKAAATPDTAEMTFGVTADGSSAKKALDAASKLATKITGSVKDLGVASEDIQTSNISVYPQYGSNGRTITGYQANISVTVKLKDLEKAGDVIGAANAAGANNIYGPTFTVSEESPYRAKAIEDAVKNARTNAEAMAKAAGKTVGEVLSISSSNVNVPVPVYAGAARDMAAAGVPIEAGQLEITADVTVVFELK